MASNDTINFLTLDVVRRMLSKSSKDAPNGVLDLSRANHFQLRSHNEGGVVKTALSGLIHVRQCENEREYFTRKVKKVILSGNDLSARADVGGSLYELRVFRRSLEQVVAINCQLDSLGWCADKEYPNLIELNLQHNYLTSIPDTSCCPRLKRLILANNEISSLSNLKKLPSTLEYLDISENHIRYSSLGETQKDLQGFSRLSNLVELKVEGNEFTLDFKDKYRQILLRIIAESGQVRLKLLDGQSTDGILALATSFSASDVAQEEEKSAEPVSLIRKNTTGAERPRLLDPSLVNKSRFYVMDYLLDQSLSGAASGTMKMMEQLQDEANRVAKGNPTGIRSESDLLFPADDSNVQLKMYEFLQKCVALSERKKEMLEPLLHVLATLSRCAGGDDNSHERQFGALCLRQLQDFMSANEEMRLLVIKVVNAELFSTPISNLENIKNTFIPELCLVAENSRCPELLVGAIKYMISRLQQVVHSPGERGAIFKAFAIASQDEREDGARAELGQEGVGEQLLQEILENNPSYDVRIWVLHTLKNLCQPGVRHGKKSDSREFGDYLASVKGFHRSLLVELSSSARMGMLDRIEGKPEQVIALEIDCLCAMLKCSRQAFADLCGAKDPQLFHLLAKYFLPKVPQLAAEAATYRTVRCLLETTFCPISVREDDSSAPPRYKRDILDDLQRVVLTNSVGNLLEYLREDSVLYADAWKVATRKLEGAPEFKDLREPFLHELFVSIINLIAAFNKEATSMTDDGSWKIAAEISETMNAKGRESRLFACLEIPSDDVKLAAVQCLDTVKLSEFEDEEIKHLVKMLQDVMNVSAGKTEEVIAISLNILTKLCLEDQRNIFQRNFGKAAVDASLRILEMNVSRDTRSMLAESEEKGVLTLACVRFLQAASKLEVTTKYLATELIAAKVDRILTVEDGFAGKVRFLSKAASAPVTNSARLLPEHDPVLIETTLAGSHVDHLAKVLMDISLAGPVAPRLLRRMANLLMSLDNGIDLVRHLPRISQESLADIRQAVRAEAADEREVSEHWYSIRQGFVNDRNLAECERHHEQFMTSLCLENILDRLDRVLQPSMPDQTLNGFTHEDTRDGEENGKEKSGLGRTLPELLERHLMSEKERQERQTEQELGGGLRIVPIELSRAEELEAQRELSSNLEYEKDLGAADSINATARLVFAALRYGSVETTASSQRILRGLNRFRTLVAHFFGSRDNPIYARSNLGTKFFLIAEAILEIPPLRRFESESQVRPLQAIVFACANRAMGLLHKKLLIHSRLASGDETLIAAVMSCCATAALQMEYVVDDNDGSERAPEELFRDLVPPSLLASAVRLLLYDMTLIKSRRNVYRNIFGETLEDDARESTIRFLAFCLRHSPTYRYSILEYLIRSNITDQYPVRRMLIQELMKRTHKLGATQRAAIEFRIKDDDEADEMAALASHDITTSLDVSSKSRSAGASSANVSSSASWNIFAWCTGADRIQKPPKSMDDTKEAADPAMPESYEKSKPADGNLRRSALDIMWDSVDIPAPPSYSDRKHVPLWQADRIGSRERVVAFTLVRLFDGNNRQKLPDVYNHALVLTSEKYLLFRVHGSDDAEHPKRWSLIWRRPYRAVFRIAVGPARLHILHRASDNHDEASATVATMLTPSRSSAREISVGFLRLCRAWRSVELSLHPSLKAPNMQQVESGMSEAFRRANFNLGNEGRRQVDRRSKDAHGLFLCEPVHICKKNGDWEPALLYVQNDLLVFAKKDWNQIIFPAKGNGSSEGFGAPLAVVLKYELHALSKIKFEVRVEDFDSTTSDIGCASLIPPFPGLVLKVGEEELAIAFVDDLSRTTWRRILS